MNGLFNLDGPNPIVKTWDHQGYNSIANYRLDPIFSSPYHHQLAQRVDDQREVIQRFNVPPQKSLGVLSDCGSRSVPPRCGDHLPYPSEDVRYSCNSYSTECKAFYPVTPYNVLPKQSPTIEFDINKLDQTDVCQVISNHTPTSFGQVSLAQTVNSLIGKMGSIQIGSTRLGTCILISEDLVITARHVVEGEMIPDLAVSFNYIRCRNDFSFQSFQTQSLYVVEDDPKCDYAIIKLKDPVGKIGYVHLNSGDPFPGETVLLHYPLEKSLQVSVNIFDQQASQYSLYSRSFHDSDNCSSGGGYFDPFQRLTAVHLGSELGADGFTISRCAIKLQDIVAQHPDSLLSCSPSTIQCCKRYLEPHHRNFLIDEEGKKSQRLFTQLLGHSIKMDKKIKSTKARIVSYSESNLEYLWAGYNSIFNKVYSECLYKTGVHAFTKQYNMSGYIESDHIIPHHVWASTKLGSMRCWVKGGGARPGENQMPAITIPYGIHRELRTTGGVPGWEAFHKKLTELCDQDRVDRAFLKCVREYKAHGINLKRKKISDALIELLDLHIGMGIIKMASRQSIVNKLS
jgi:Trypsin-like peptidase domain